jgi:hypothetical protein
MENNHAANMRHRLMITEARLTSLVKVLEDYRHMLEQDRWDAGEVKESFDRELRNAIGILSNEIDRNI